MVRFMQQCLEYLNAQIIFNSVEFLNLKYKKKQYTKSYWTFVSIRIFQSFLNEN